MAEEESWQMDKGALFVGWGPIIAGREAQAYCSAEMQALFGLWEEQEHRLLP